MKKRRQFIRLMLGFFAGMGFYLSPLTTGVRWVWAKAKKVVLPKGTRMKNLIGRNPADLDTRNLDLTPLEEFETMGLDDHPVKFTYSQLTEIPPVKIDVLLICPGFFAYHARWEGVSAAKLLEMARVSPDVTHVSFSGPSGRYEKTDRFPLEDILSDRVFLAYRVNGRALPQKHGFPLRLVAEGYYGGDWVKYVCKVTAHKS